MVTENYLNTFKIAERIYTESSEFMLLMLKLKSILRFSNESNK